MTARSTKRRTSTPAPRQQGAIEQASASSLHGWAVDLDRPGRPAELILLVDGRPCSTFLCTTLRPELDDRGAAGVATGFAVSVPEAVLDGGRHRVAIRFRSGQTLPLVTGGGTLDEIAFPLQPATIGHIEGLSGLAVDGWALLRDERSGRYAGGVTVEVRSNGTVLDRVKATLHRQDVADQTGGDPLCGFQYVLPPHLRDGRQFSLEFVAAEDGTPLDGSPLRAAAPMRDTLERLQGMFARMETLCTELYALKDQLRRMSFADAFTVRSYAGWAAGYDQALMSRLVAARRTARYAALLGSPPPTVSVVCPAYKPNLADFTATIDSVRRQTWPHWELLIVDDGSASKALKACIAEYCARDARIRALPHRRNQGIAAATNTAIAAATGEYVAFLDHDDLLADAALEIMVLAARHTGARLLYSDEDKIDRLGQRSEPHLKPDWNYRRLLAVNYVCHLLMVERALLREAGPLDSRFDGAQDHDLVLRLAERVPPAAIHHVPEILYHWRRSEGSTASGQLAKPYAVAAGRAALLAHARRRGLQATVTAPFGTTVYDLRWQFAAEPRVAILVPFKDQLDMTRRCVDAVLGLTRYANFELVLIDNGSAEPAMLAWLDAMRGRPGVRVIRIEEPFNYARLNNLAARQVETDFLLFLNNDVIVAQPEWLRVMMDEALAGPKVGIVGVRLMYPNGTVQHAGVVLGVGGVADHAFRFAAAADPGYTFRATTAQDYSAVTAACMLCRAEAFHAVGGFDAERLAVAFNDVDLCLKVGRAGYRVVYTPAVVAEHRESLSRGNGRAPQALSRLYEETQVMSDRWGPLIARDPHYNPHFSRADGMFDRLATAAIEPHQAPPLLRDDQADSGRAAATGAVGPLPSAMPATIPAPRRRRRA